MHSQSREHPPPAAREHGQAFDADVTRDGVGPAATIVCLVGHGAIRLAVPRRATRIEGASPQVIVAITGAVAVRAVSDTIKLVKTCCLIM